MAYRMAEGVGGDDFEEGLAAVRDIGPGGHDLGHSHTLENVQRAIFLPELFDNNSIEHWAAEGTVETPERSLTRAKALLADDEKSALDRGMNNAHLDYIAQREQEIPAADALDTTH